ncbi:MAG: ADP-ribosylglycohydrolase family protein [Firmicutes bacterium]|nr:ADP-ribosylglycohydrolase family protein [Bacillota bacterium]
MLGAIIGDIAGSRFEFHNIKSKEFELFHLDCRFTDDSVMTLAVAAALMDKTSPQPLEQRFVSHMQRLGRAYPKAGYGGRFHEWIFSPQPAPYNSWGNGSAMRVSPCGEAARSLGDAASLARKSAAVTHDHPEGIRGAEAVAVAIFLARGGRSKEEIRDHIRRYYYDIDFGESFTLDRIRPGYRFDVSCQGSVPQALEAFFESGSLEDTVRGAISIGGDSDTIAAIAGSIAENYYGLDAALAERAMEYLPEELAQIVYAWYNTDSVV